MGEVGNGIVVVVIIIIIIIIIIVVIRANLPHEIVEGVLVVIPEGLELRGVGKFVATEFKRDFEAVRNQIVEVLHA